MYNTGFSFLFFSFFSPPFFPSEYPKYVALSGPSFAQPSSQRYEIQLDDGQRRKKKKKRSGEDDRLMQGCMYNNKTFSTLLSPSSLSPFFKRRRGKHKIKYKKGPRKHYLRNPIMPHKEYIYLYIYIFIFRVNRIRSFYQWLNKTKKQNNKKKRRR